VSAARDRFFVWDGSAEGSRLALLFSEAEPEAGSSSGGRGGGLSDEIGFSTGGVVSVLAESEFEFEIEFSEVWCCCLSDDGWFIVDRCGRGRVASLRKGGSISDVPAEHDRL